tara:strand:- start:6452 stop:8107 length:1656 start_codon:yes stop_codon:yes gene_type:complete
MTAIVSSNFRVVNANNFKEDVKNSNVYVTIGKADAWSPSTSDTTDTTPFIPKDHLEDQNNARRQFIGMQKLTSADVSHVVKRHDWTTGTVYVPWDSDDEDIYDRNPCFYVLTNEFKVYKCLRNGNGAQSTVQPTHTTARPTGSAVDGYIWKYMYSITTADSEKFLTNAYMPVKNVPVTIEAFVAAAGATNQAKILLKQPNADIKVGHRVKKGNTTLGEISAIAGAEITLQANLAATVSVNDILVLDFEDDDHASTALSTDFVQYKAQKDSLLLDEAGGIERIEIPSGQGGSGYSGNPTSITVASDGETNAVIKPADVTIVGNSITAIDIGPDTGTSGSLHGKNITVATITVAGGGASTQATPKAIIAPNKGHGTNPVEELGGYLVALNTQLTGSGGGDLTVGNDFRQISIIKNPRVHNATPYAGTLATSATLNPLKALNITGGGDVADFSVDDVITGSSSGAKAFVAYVDTSDSNNKVYYYQNEKTGFTSFATSSETISAQDGAGGSGFSVTSISAADVDSRTGELLFLENRTPINRSLTQIEDIKLILEF